MRSYAHSGSTELFTKFVAKLSNELSAELEDSSQLSYKKPQAKLENIVCSEARCLASWVFFREQQLAYYYLLHWISGVQITVLSIRDGHVFNLSATCFLEVSTS